MPVIEISNDEMWKILVLRWAHEFVWDKIVEEVVEELAGSDCPNYDSCSESAIENYEPMVNEGYS